jgi:hypothetical protein
MTMAPRWIDLSGAEQLARLYADMHDGGGAIVRYRDELYRVDAARGEHVQLRALGEPYREGFEVHVSEVTPHGASAIGVSA